jgi:ATP-binding cassette subfamily B protein
LSATAADRPRLSTHSFVPTGIEARYRPPRATIDPDKSKSWLGRARPIVMAHKLTLATALGMSFVALVLQVQIPNLLNNAVTNSLQRHTVPLSHYVTLVLALAVATGVAAYISRLFLLRTAYAMEFDLRNIIYEHLTRMSFGFYDRVQSGQLISRANSDIRSVQMYLTFAPAIIVQCTVALVAFAYMLSINVPLAFVAMSTTPLVYFSSVRMRKQIFPVSWLIQQRLADIATIVDENINGVRVVKSFVAEPRELSTLAKAAERLKWAYVRDADIRAKFTPTVQNLPQVGLALVLIFGGWLVIHGHLHVGAILAFSAYIVMLQAPFQLLGMLIMLGQRARASAGRIYQILDEAPEIVDRPGAVDLVECEGDVRFEAVDFRYGDGPLVLSELSLHLSPGETVAMVGRTASGKTTISRLLPRFYDVSAGSVKVDGHDVRDLTLASLRAQIGVVLDEPYLFTASIRENIAYGRPDAPLEEVVVAARAANAEKFIAALPDGYDTVVGERGYTLSGG